MDNIYVANNLLAVISLQGFADAKIAQLADHVQGVSI